jgi:recombination protein RecA
MFGNPETTTGGRALRFYASVRLDIRKIDTIKVGNEFVGNRTRVKVVKNKVAPPFKTCEFDIMYGKGISKEGDVLDLAINLNIVNKSGTWFSYNETRMGQGRENAKDFLKQHPEVCHEIENSVRKYYGMKELEALALPENYVQPGDLTEAEPEVTQEDLMIDEMFMNGEDPESGAEGAAADEML